MSAPVRTILLMRHAESPPAGSDFERPISAYGAGQAAQVGALLLAQGIAPDTLLCSPAARTRATFDGMGLPVVRAEYPQSLYNAMPGEILTLLQGLPDATQIVLVLAHNPGIFTAVQMLWNRAPTPAAQSFAFGYPPASCAVLQVQGDWAALVPGCAVLRDIVMV